MIGNFTEISGDSSSNILDAEDLQIAFGFGGNDFLFTSFGLLPEGEKSAILAGGFGDDEYQIANNLTTVIVENGDSNQDSLVALGLGINSDTSFIAEIDGRHLYAGDRESNQYVILIDWQQPANQIESITVSDGTFSYDEIATTFRQLENYAGNFTWGELEQQDELNLERVGLTELTVNDAINQIAARAILFDV